MAGLYEGVCWAN